MAAKDISNFFIYRWRYIVGYGIIALLLAGLLMFAGLYVPGGISPEEMRATVRSDSLSFSDPSTFAVTSLPFYLLQKFVFHFFGITDFSIKVPALMLALFSAIGLILLLRRWFKPNIAVLTSLIAITTGQFLFIAQNGTPSILYIFWPILLLSLGTQVTRSKKGKLFWNIAFATTAALSLYTPLSIYPLIAIALAVTLHPHLRTIVRRLSKVKIAMSTLIAALLVAPLAYLIAIKPQLGLSLLGVPTNLPPDIGDNIATLAKQFFIFWEPSTTTLMTPVFGLGSVLIIILGVYRLIKTRDTTRSYLIIIWMLCLIPVLLVNPQFTTVTLVPAVLLLAAGLTSLISYWYRLFPLNPYARITGLVPIVILVVVLIGSGIDRYVYGYHYSPSTATNFSNDLKLLPKNTKNLVVSSDELAFYTAVSHHRESLQVTTTPLSTDVVATRSARNSITSSYEITKIITTTYSQDSDRLYIYKKISQ
ncbi:glycosyltransferase family 39 protein [Candidatus Saccharibacteria bacterium]|nr:glycosyltransferase family 39 protein [Candidatus Saccharibacteria bacterium]